MKKSTKIILMISICLISVGIVLSAIGRFAVLRPVISSSMGFGMHPFVTETTSIMTLKKIILTMYLMRP